MRSIIFISLAATGFAVSAEQSATSFEKENANQSLSYSFNVHITDGDSNVSLSVTKGNQNTRQVSVTDSDNDDLLKALETSIETQGVEHFSNTECDSFKSMIPDDKITTENAEGNIVYSFTPIPAEDDDPDIFKELTGNAVLTPSSLQILTFRLNNEKDLSPAFGTSIETFTYAITCVPITDEMTVIESSHLSVKGSAFLVPFQEKLHRNYSNYSILPSTNLEY